MEMISGKREKTISSNGEVIFHTLNDAGWGVIVSGTDESAANKKFEKAVIVSKIVKSVLLISEMIEMGRWDEKIITQTEKESKRVAHESSF